MSSLEVSAALGALVVAVAGQRGADVERLLAITGFDPKGATDADARIPLDLEHALWGNAAELARDDAFGVHAAELVKPGMFDVLDYAVRTAPTLRQSLERLVRYNRLVHDAAVWSLVPREGVLRVEHTFSVEGIVQDRHAAEFTLSSIVTIGAQIASMPIRPLAVGFRHAKPASREAQAELTRMFGVEPQFLQPMNYIELDGELVGRENPKADPALSRLIERHAETLLAARPEPTLSTRERVQHVLAITLGEGEAALADVARKLKMSERSLQRRLADEGVTFDALLDKVRRDLALRYLADPKIAVAEVAFLLGYSEPSPFHRAFKRWTGKTPSEMRKRAA
ncbi:MAG TPA: AraC family transcriptional regulator [Polyangiaceae bacterium]|nr:AraC family transcriptional regulator [Polyangiaceae bacterium]